MAYEVFQPCESVMQNTEMFIRPWLKMQCNTNSVCILFNLDVKQHYIYVASNGSFTVRCMWCRRKLQPSMKLRDGKNIDFFCKK